MKCYELEKLNGENRVIPYIDEFMDMVKGVKIELGCGKNKKEGYVGIDCFADPVVDITMDLDGNVLPFADEHVSAIRAIHILEHIWNVEKIWSEMFRVIKDGGLIYAVVPHPQGGWYFQDPTHKSFYNEKTFTKYFDPAFMESYTNYPYMAKAESICTFIHGQTFDKLAVHSLLRITKI